MYWHLTLRVTPYMCKDRIEQIIVDIDPLDWQQRHDKTYDHRYMPKTEILQYREVTKAAYLRYLRTK